MMIGEFDYEDHFVAKGTWFDLYYILPNLIFVVFVLLASILLHNLMIAMTINETDKIYKKADIITAERQIYPIIMGEQVGKM